MRGERKEKREKRRKERECRRRREGIFLGSFLFPLHSFLLQASFLQEAAG
jgi:hypothetical protein